MWYWRDDNFKGLTDVAERLESEPDFALYVAYLRHREKGLRKQALKLLDEYVTLASTWAFDRRRDVVHRIMTLKHELPNVMDLVPTNLHRGLVLPTLDDWAQRSRTDPVPLRWRGRDDDLRRAAKLDPHEHIARIYLATRLLYRAEYSAHELPYGYLGETAEDLSTLNEVDELLAHVPTGMSDPLKDKSYELREEITAYSDFTASGSADTFFNWLREKGHPLYKLWSRNLS